MKKATYVLVILALSAMGAWAGYTSRRVATTAAQTPCKSTGFETCDGIDNNCDGQVDNVYWYRDCDGDGYVRYPFVKVQSCSRPDPVEGCSWRGPPFGRDCDDTDETKHGDGYGVCQHLWR